MRFRGIIVAFALAFAALAGAQTQIDPTTQIHWPWATGITPPSAVCGAAQYGEPYTNTSTGVMYVCATSGWVNVASGTQSWPSGGAGIPNYTGSNAWGTTYNASNLIPAAFIAILNQNTTGTAGNVTATSNATLTTLSALSLPYAQLTGAPAIPTSANWPNAGACTAGQYVSALVNGNASTCGVVQYAQLGGTVTTWNQNTTGNAATATNINGNGTGNQVWGMNSGGSAQGWQTLSGGAFTSFIAGSNVTLTGSGCSGGTCTSGAVTVTASSTGATAFSALTTSTNTQAAMLVGTGASLGVTGTGTIGATSAPVSGLTGAGTGVLTALGDAVNASGGIASYPVAYGNVSGTPQLAQALALVAHKYFTSYTASTGLFTAAQPVSADLSDLGAANGAAQLGSGGFLPAAQGGFGINTSALTGCPSDAAGAWSVGTCYTGTVTGSGTTNYYALFSSSTVVGNGTMDHGVTTANVDTDTYALAAPSFRGTGATPSSLILPAGTGNIPTLPANAGGFAAPTSGGTSWLGKLPATITAGILHFAAPATGDGVNESAITSSAINLASGDVTGQLPIGAVGSAGLSGTAPIAINSAGAISCPTCDTGTINNAAQYAIAYYSAAGTVNTVSGLAAPTTNADWFSGYHITGGVASAPVNEELVTSTTNSVGLTVTPTYNATGPTQRFEITGSSYTGNATTATNASGLVGCTTSTAGSICYWNGSAWVVLAGNASGTNWLQETAAGVPSWTTPGGSGTVTVVGAGSLTSTALVTGGGTTTLQTPSATSTLSSGGNISLAGTITGASSATLGTNGGTGGSVVLNGATSGSATINTSGTGVLALPSGTTATSMGLTTPLLGTPTSGVITNLTGTCTSCVASSANAVNSNTFPASAGFTSGGILYNNSTSSQATSALLTHYGLVYGGGAAGSPVSMAACGANFPVVGVAAAAPACSTIGWLTSATQWGIPYMSTATQMSTTAALTANALIKAGSSAAPSASAVTDNGTLVTSTEPLTLTPGARSSGALAYMTVNAPADTGITTATESIGINNVGATRTWVDGTVATQREYLFQAPTYNKTTTSATFTKAATLAVSAAPTAGSGVTITNPYAFWVQAGAAELDGGAVTTTLSASTSVTAALYATTTKCAAAGSAASPSLVACSAAPAGLFSCATNASAATCVISTTAVTANSVIQIQPDSSLGTALSVTCNTTADSALTAPRVSARTAATSFTITLGTFTTNPLCFSYLIIN